MAKEDKHLLYDLDITAVAGVDRAANRRQFLVIKRADKEGGESMKGTGPACEDCKGGNCKDCPCVKCTKADCKDCKETPLTKAGTGPVCEKCEGGQCSKCACSKCNKQGCQGCQETPLGKKGTGPACQDCDGKNCAKCNCQDCEKDSCKGCSETPLNKKGSGPACEDCKGGPCAKCSCLKCKKASCEGCDETPLGKADGKKPMKTEAGVQYPAEAYAHVPDPSKPSDWKIRLWDDSKKETPKQIGMAAAALSPGGFRGNQAKIPSEDLPGVKAKVRAAWKRVNPDAKPEDMPDVLKSDGTGGNMVERLLVRLGIKKSASALEGLEQVLEALKAEGVLKIGRKINAEKLGNMKEIHQSLGQLIDWAEASDEAGNDDLGDEDGAGDGAGPGASGDAEGANNALDFEGQLDTDKNARKGLNKNVDKQQEELLKGEMAALKKSNEDLKKQNETIVAQLTAQAELNKAEKELRVKNECIAKAAGFKYLSTPTAELGEMLYKAAQSMTPEDYAKLEATFKAANEAAKNAGVFSVIGSDATSKGAGAVEKVEAMAKEMISKSSGKLSHAAAMADIFKNDPQLYAEYDAEQKAGGYDRDDGINE